MFWETMQGRRNQIPADGDWKILYDIDKARWLWIISSAVSADLLVHLFFFTTNVDILFSRTVAPYVRFRLFRHMTSTRHGPCSVRCWPKTYKRYQNKNAPSLNRAN